MGAKPSKQIAERVLSACQSVNEDDKIDKILLKDEVFRETISSLAPDIRASLRVLLVQPKKQRQDYGGPEITESRPFDIIWKAPKPILQPAIQEFLSACHQNPRNAFERPSEALPDSFANYLNYLLVLDRNRKIDTVRWRLFLTALPSLIERFHRVNAHSKTRNDIVTIICESGYILWNKDEIRKSLQFWIGKGKRYNNVASRIGYGGLCALPEELNDTFWESRLPKKGDIYDACIQVLVDRGIQTEATKKIAEDDENVVTANMAANKVVQYLKDLICEYPIINDSFKDHPRQKRKQNETDRDEVRLAPDLSRSTEHASPYHQEAPGHISNGRGSSGESRDEPASNGMSTEDTPELSTSPSETTVSSNSPESESSDVNAAGILMAAANRQVDFRAGLHNPIRVRAVQDFVTSPALPLYR